MSTLPTSPASRWWRGGLGAVTLAVLLATSLLAVGCQSPVASSAKKGSAKALAGVSLSPDLVTAYFPVSGVEQNQPSSVRHLVDGLYQDASLVCYRNRGFPMGAHPLDVEIRYLHMPDLPYIEEHGFEISFPAVGPLYSYDTMSQAQQDAMNSAVRECDVAGRKPVRALKDLLDPLTEQWQAEVEGLQGDPAVLNAYQGFVRCLHGKGIDVADEEGFFRYSEGIAQAGSHVSAEQAARRLATARIYVPCITPVEKARIALRTSLRQSFFADHADVLRQVQAAADGLINRYPRAKSSPSRFNG